LTFYEAVKSGFCESGLYSEKHATLSFQTLTAQRWLASSESNVETFEKWLRRGSKSFSLEI
jgi:hypothetical protein